MHNAFLFSLLMVSALFLSACSSTVETTNYYLLTNNMTNQDKANDAVLIPTVLSAGDEQRQYLVSVVLPEYLHKPYLVMQLNENQIHYAMFHLWAEPLDKGLSTALIFDLNTNKQEVFFISAQGKEHTLSNIISVEVSYFHINEQGSVILSGQYHMQTASGMVHRAFSFTQPLADDGYSHAIVQMRTLITQLSEKIIAEL